MADVDIPLGAFWDLVREAVLFGYVATAVFCAIAGVAVALWARLPWWVGLLAGALALYAGLLALLLVGGVRSAQRVGEARAARRGFAGAVEREPVVRGPVVREPVVREPGVRAGVRRGWRRWTRTPPTRTEWLVAVLTLLLAAGLVAATQVTWLTVSAVGHDVTGVGPFAIQLGLFVVVSALVAVVCAAGVLRRRSAWWPVLLAWCGTWWVFVAVEARRSEGAFDALNRLLRDQVRERVGYDVRPELDLGVGWTMMAALAAAMVLLAVVLLVLQGRRGSHYRLVPNRDITTS